MIAVPQVGVCLLPRPAWLELVALCVCATQYGTRAIEINPLPHSMGLTCPIAALHPCLAGADRAHLPALCAGLLLFLRNSVAFPHTRGRAALTTHALTAVALCSIGGSSDSLKRLKAP